MIGEDGVNDDDFDGTAKISQARADSMPDDGFNGIAKLPQALENGVAEDGFDGTDEITQARLSDVQHIRRAKSRGCKSPQTTL